MKYLLTYSLYLTKLHSPKNAKSARCTKLIHLLIQPKQFVITLGFDVIFRSMLYKYIASVYLRLAWRISVFS